MNLLASIFENRWKETTAKSLQEIILYYLGLKKTTNNNRISGPGAQNSTGISDQEIVVMFDRDIQT